MIRYIDFHSLTIKYIVILTFRRFQNIITIDFVIFYMINIIINLKLRVSININFFIMFNILKLTYDL